MAKIKGAAIRTMLDWYRAENGDVAYREVLGALSQREQEELDGGEVLPSVWYDAALVHRILEIVMDPLPPSERTKFARGAARAGFAVLSRSLYKFMLQQVVSPALYARHIQRLFRLLHDTGQRRIEMGEQEALSVTLAWAGHHPLLCVVVNETTAVVFETLGCSDVTVERVSCVSNGARDCRCRLRWQ